MNAYHPHQSVNYIASHDGFTLYDLVAYSQKRNWANGHGNTDGAEENHSWNCGWEGDEGAPPEVVNCASNRSRISVACYSLRTGHPCSAPATSSCTRRRGNNNPYNQDNEVGWID